MELREALSRVDLFAGLDASQIEQVARVFEPVNLARGSVLFREGDPSDALYVVLDGFLQVALEPGDAREAGRSLVQMGPGQSVGELSLVDGGPRSATVTAVTPKVALARASRAALDALCEDDTAIGYRVMRNIAADVAYKLRFRDLRG